MKLPEALLKSLQGIEGFDRQAFEKVHISGEQITSIRKNPSKFSPPDGNDVRPVPWSKYGYYLASRPSFTFDPLFHAGCYYVQEASSMFLEQALGQTIDLSKPLKVLDLCASPGGKSTHLQSLISTDSLLVSNEVIRSRANVLKDNIIKWGCGNVVVTSNDPKDFAKLENYFDVIVVDAPCSGSGLFRRDDEAINEWSENNVALCSQRQQRILADVWPALKKNGVFIYSTCSYSIEEDEKIVDWMTNKLPAVNCRLHIANDWGITETVSPEGAFCYRFWPDKVKGEGFFLTCFKKMGGDDGKEIKTKNKLSEVDKKEKDIVGMWVNLSNKKFIKHKQTVYAWPGNLYTDFSYILENLKVIYSGTIVGEIIREKLVPDHALALSDSLNSAIRKIELNYDDAIKYLQRKDILISSGDKGWAVVTYGLQPIGWINVLANRVNNYYPKELRILKDK